jgi:hypothetical protein
VAAIVYILTGPASEHTMGPNPGTAFVICAVALTSLAAAPAAGMGLGYLAASDAAASQLGTAARGRRESLMRRSLSQVGPLFSLAQKHPFGLACLRQALVPS